MSVEMDHLVVTRPLLETSAQGRERGWSQQLDLESRPGVAKGTREGADDRPKLIVGGGLRARADDQDPERPVRVERRRSRHRLGRQSVEAAERLCQVAPRSFEQELPGDAQEGRIVRDDPKLRFAQPVDDRLVVERARVEALVMRAKNLLEQG
jgi:hypothetical protein